MTALTTAIVGCGVIGRTHVDAVLYLAERLVLTALVDVSTDGAEALAASVEERTGTRPAVYATIEELVAAQRVDLVVIATPSGLHVEQAVAALEAGAHVLIEKPLDVDLVRARRLADAAYRARTNDQVVSIISQHRFDPSSSIVRSAVEEGRFGRVTSAVATVPWWRSQEYYDSGTWRGTWALDGGGALMNQGVHTVDLLLWMLGRPVSISAEYGLLAHEGIEVEDTVVATVTFDTGALAVLHATTAGYPGINVRLQVHGSEGTAVIDAERLEYLHLKGGSEGNQAGEYPGEDEPIEGLTGFTTGHVRQYLDMLGAIEERRDPLLTVDDAVLALATVRGVYVSATLGEKVRIDDVISGVHDGVELVVPASFAAVAG